MAKKNGLALQKQIDRAFAFAYWSVLFFVVVAIVAAVIYTNTHDNYVNDEPITVYAPTIPELENISYSPVLTKEIQPSEEETDIENKYKTEAEYIAKTVWGEARGCNEIEQEAVVWCILNRVDSDDPFFPDNIIDVISQPYQFAGYSDSNPVDGDMYDLALDVLGRWEAEKGGEKGVGRILPSEYIYFHGDGEHNYFRKEYEAFGDYWDLSTRQVYD